MSHFYTESNGAGQTSATRRGHKSTGANSHTRGYKNGGRVEVWHSDDCDHVRIELTEGSNNYGNVAVPRAVVIAKQAHPDSAETEIIAVDIDGYLCLPLDDMPPHNGLNERQKQAILNAATMIIKAG